MNHAKRWPACLPLLLALGVCSCSGPTSTSAPAETPSRTATESTSAPSELQAEVVKIDPAYASPFAQRHLQEWADNTCQEIHNGVKGEHLRSYVQQEWTSTSIGPVSAKTADRLVALVRTQQCK